MTSPAGRPPATSLQELFTERVVARDLRIAPGDEHDELLAVESIALGKVSAGRRRDFSAGRACARAALVALGEPPAPILRGEKREPLWPTGVVGSITHTSLYAAAAVARSAEVRSLGIDAEPDEPLPAGVLRWVGSDSEQRWVASAGAAPGVANPDRLLFCAKEATYKAWFPLAECWLGFKDAEVSVVAPGEFDVEILIDGPIRSMRGRYSSIDGRIVAAIELPGQPEASS